MAQVREARYDFATHLKRYRGREPRAILRA
jgi:hypothetical protein